MKKNYLVMLLTIILLIGCFSGPYLFRDLVGEEGIFTMTSYYPLHMPEIVVIGREDMQLKRSIPKHPITAYLALRFLGFFVQKFHIFSGLLFNPISYIILLRFSLLIFNLIFIFLLLRICLKKLVYRENRLLFILFTLGLFSSIFFCLSFSHIQYETTSILLVALSLSLAISALYCKYAIIQTINLVLAGLVFGLGKNEWNITAFLAVLSSFIMCRLPKEKMYGMKFMLGLFLGNIISCILSPVNYLNGFGLITEFTIAQRSFYNLFSRIFFLKNIVFWFWKEIILIIVLTVLIVKKYRKNCAYGNDWFLCFVLLFLLLYIAALLIASWPGDGFPRYFMVCMPFLLVLAAIYMKEKILHPVARRLLFIFVFFIIINIGQHFFTKSGFRSAFVINKTLDCSERLKEQGSDGSCIYIVSSGVGWYLPTLNFFHNDIQTKNMIHKKPLCKFTCGDN